MMVSSSISISSSSMKRRQNKRTDTYHMNPLKLPTITTSSDIILLLLKHAIFSQHSIAVERHTKKNKATASMKFSGIPIVIIIIPIIMFFVIFLIFLKPFSTDRVHYPLPRSLLDQIQWKKWSGQGGGLEKVTIIIIGYLIYPALAKS